MIAILPIAIIYFVAWHLAEFSPSATADAVIGPACTECVLTAVAIAVAQQLQFVTTMREREVLNESDDILQFAESHPGVVAMGYGSTESLSTPIFSTNQRSASTNSSGRRCRTRPFVPSQTAA